MNTRTCTHCHVTKPATLEHFYKGATNADRLTSWCKDCMKARSKSNSKLNIQSDTKPRDDGEALALLLFLNQGIPADLGKNTKGMAWVDLVLWGCIKVEVKYSQKPIQWQWVMTSTNNPKTVAPDVVLLIGKHVKTQLHHYFILTPNHPVFINSDGSRKKSYGYSYLNRIGKQGFTIDPLLQHENNFALIEQKRLAYSQQLIEVARAA